MIPDFNNEMPTYLRHNNANTTIVDIYLDPKVIGSTDHTLLQSHQWVIVPNTRPFHFCRLPEAHVINCSPVYPSERLYTSRKWPNVKCVPPLCLPVLQRIMAACSVEAYLQQLSWRKLDPLTILPSRVRPVSPLSPRPSVTR